MSKQFNPSNSNKATIRRAEVAEYLQLLFAPFEGLDPDDGDEWRSELGRFTADLVWCSSRCQHDPKRFREWYLRVLENPDARDALTCAHFIQLGRFLRGGGRKLRRGRRKA